MLKCICIAEGRKREGQTAKTNTVRYASRIVGNPHALYGSHGHLGLQLSKFLLLVFLFRLGLASYCVIVSIACAPIDTCIEKDLRG